jgi:nitric oxide reductase large subunit
MKQRAAFTPRTGKVVGVVDIWTIVFVIVLVIGFGIAAWHDRDEKKREERRISAYEKKDKSDE